MTISVSAHRSVLRRIFRLLKPQHYSNVPYSVLFLIIAVYCTSKSLCSKCSYNFMCVYKVPCHLHSSDSELKNSTHLVFGLVWYFGNSMGISYTHMEQ